MNPIRSRGKRGDLCICWCKPRRPRGLFQGTRRKLYIEPARLETRSFQRTEGEPKIVRRAKAFRDIVQGMTITIHPEELIVGNRSPLPRMGVVTASAAAAWVDKELETLSTRAQDPFEVDPQDIHELRDKIFPYWRGNTLEDQVAAAIPPEVKEAVEAKVFQLNQTDHAQGHVLPNVGEWLREGPSGLRLRAAAGRDNLAGKGELGREQADFYDAVEVSLTAASDFMLRYATLASELGHAETSRQRTQELQRIACNCRRIAERPPRDFLEALQSGALLFVLLQIESNASSFSPGRFDQYMISHFRRDLEEETLTLLDAEELVECLWIKFNEMVLPRIIRTSAGPSNARRAAASCEDRTTPRVL